MRRMLMAPVLLVGGCVCVAGCGEGLALFDGNAVGQALGNGVTGQGFKTNAELREERTGSRYPTPDVEQVQYPEISEGYNVRRVIEDLKDLGWVLVSESSHGRHGSMTWEFNEYRGAYVPSNYYHLNIQYEGTVVTGYTKTY